jgi:tetratricopeptide (TPR) repeat protein
MRRLGMALAAGALLLPAAGDPARAQGQPQEQPQGSARARAARASGPLADLRAGRYDEAIAGFRRALLAQPADVAAHANLVRALLEIGRDEEAELAARAGVAAASRSALLGRLLGDALAARGRLDEAESAYAKAAGLPTAGALRATAELAALRWLRGDRPRARAGFEALVAAYNGDRARSADDLVGVGIATRGLGAENPDAFKDALKAFDEAAAAEPESLELRLLVGELFLEKYNSPEARESFREVLAANPRHPRALLGLARALDFDGERGVLDLLQKSLETNPRSPEARAFQSQVSLSLEDYDAALREAQAGLEANPASLDALAALASVHYLRGDRAAFEEARRRALAISPGDASLETAVAEACVRNRLYADAVDLARQALTRDPRSPQAQSTLGLNLLRLGRIEEGREALTLSFEADPYDVWVKNTLDLLDSFPRYRTLESGRFRLFVDAKEADLLASPLGTLAEQALSALEARYRTRVSGPIRVEVYPSHADFSVRTVGLAGLGALGVCFGPVVAIDSPSAREPGSFNWGSTLWHELAHTVHMQISAQRVPRWLTEGLAVLEERNARPGWGDDVSVDFLLALKGGRLLPLAKLNDGFVRPTSPEQVGLSYYQASLVVERIEAQKGMDAILALLRGYGEGRLTRELFESVLGTSMEDFDSAFTAELEARWRGPLAALKPAGDKAPTRAELEARAQDPQDFLANALVGRALYEEKRRDEAKRHLERAAELFPESAGEESPWWPLARLQKDQGDARGAIASLQRLVARNENHFAARLMLGELLEAASRRDEAAEVLESAVFVYPLEPKLFERLAALHEARGDRAGVLRARRALVALSPANTADAFYALAVAYLDAGDRASARREVLKALEAAPRFERAQELLLRIRRLEKAGQP